MIRKIHAELFNRRTREVCTPALERRYGFMEKCITLQGVAR